MARRAEPSRTRTSKPQCGSPTLTVICWEMKEACLPQCFLQFVASLWANVNKQHMRKFLNCNPQPLFTTRLRLGNELESVATPVLSGCLRISKSKGPRGAPRGSGYGSSRVQNDWYLYPHLLGPLGHWAISKDAGSLGVLVDLASNWKRSQSLRYFKSHCQHCYISIANICMIWIAPS